MAGFELDLTPLFIRAAAARAKPRSYLPPPLPTVHRSIVWTFCMLEGLIGVDIIDRMSPDSHQTP